MFKNIAFGFFPFCKGKIQIFLKEKRKQGQAEKGFLDLL